MSDGTNFPDEVVQNDPAGMRKVLEKQGKELAEKDEALSERDKIISDFQRAEVFRTAGIPDGEDGTVQALFRESYKGELTAESIREGWDKLGIPQLGQDSPASAEAQQVAGEQPVQQAEQQSGVDAVTAAAIADGQQIRTQFSPGLEDASASLLEAIGSATSAQEIEDIARAGGIQMPE